MVRLWVLILFQESLGEFGSENNFKDEDISECFHDTVVEENNHPLIMIGLSYMVTFMYFRGR